MNPSTSQPPSPEAEEARLERAIQAVGAEFALLIAKIGAAIGIGLAVVPIILYALLPDRHVGFAVAGCIIGSILYRLAVAAALNAEFIGLTASDLNLITALLVALALILPGARNPLKMMFARGGAK